MSTLYVRDIPEDVISTLKKRASMAGQSLQAYARQLLLTESRTPTLEDVQVEAHSIALRNSVTDVDILGEISAIREARKA